MMGIITTQGPEDALLRLKEQPRYDDTDYVHEVTAAEPYTWPPGGRTDGKGPRITVVDMGVKYNILRILQAKGCRLSAMPASASAKEILATRPDGVLLSPGPGDPALLKYLVNTVKGLLGHAPIMSICLGHQVLAHALGGSTFKLKFGHRGGNHPVKELETGRVSITAQNHGYAVDADSLPPEVVVSHVNLNDGTVEGFRHRELPIMSIQYHSEAAPGPLDNIGMFDRFLDLVRQGK